MRLDSTPRLLLAAADRRLPFEPRPEMRPFRDQLRAGVRRLDVGTDEILHCVYSSPDRSMCDVENVTVYNVGTAAFASAASNGLIVERSYATDVDLQHQWRYEPIAHDRSFLHWATGAPLVSWDAPWPAITSDGKPARHWAAAKASGLLCDASTSLPADRPFAVDVEIAVPAGVRPRPAAWMKPLVDGILSACHVAEPVHRAAVERVATALELPSSQIITWLTDDHTAVLGSVDLVRPFRSGVQWHPADDRCVALRVTVRPSTTGWRCAGVLHDVIPIAGES